MNKISGHSFIYTSVMNVHTYNFLYLLYHLFTILFILLLSFLLSNAYLSSHSTAY